MNARKELRGKIENLPKIKCAMISFREEGDNGHKEYLLKVGYSQEEYNKFMEDLSSLDYDDGYGTQELFGIVWLEGDMWLVRGEYDGSEWWELCSYPDIPNKLLK